MNVLNRLVVHVAIAMTLLATMTNLAIPILLGADAAAYIASNANTRPLVTPSAEQVKSPPPMVFAPKQHPQKQTSSSFLISDIQTSYGMPWKSSFDPRANKIKRAVTEEGTNHPSNDKQEQELVYMKFWEWQMSFIQENLTNLQVHHPHPFQYQENTKKHGRIFNMHLSSQEYRKIRMTYYDAGDKTQVFNSLWYPQCKYGTAPVLGIDLLAFGKKKYLVVIDFQPIRSNINMEEEECSSHRTAQKRLQQIKDKYDSLKGCKMSKRFYDETQFFSKEMIFARFDVKNPTTNPVSIINNELFPAFQESVQAHVQLLHNIQEESHENSLSTTATRKQNEKELDNHNDSTIKISEEFVLERQKAYDMYSSERDPAKGLLGSMFGQEWANDFIHNFLFSMSSSPSSIEQQAR